MLYFRAGLEGEMLEWLKRHAWKACKPLKGFAGSNPALSAVRTASFIFLPFLFSYIHR